MRSQSFSFLSIIFNNCLLCFSKYFVLYSTQKIHHSNNDIIGNKTGYHRCNVDSDNTEENNNDHGDHKDGNIDNN